MLKDKKILITGASRGIGRAIAIKCSKEGAVVGINYTSNEEKAKEVLDEINSFGGIGVLLKADVTNEKEVKEMVKTFSEEFGDIDVLVNNAGVTSDQLLIRLKESNWDKVMDVNLKGTFLPTKEVARKMLKRKAGSIINVSSVVGIVGNPGQSNYCASKAGIIGFTKAMAKELGSKGIRVNAIAPGFIKTDMTDVLNDDIKAKMIESIPLKREGSPDEVADLVTFLASDNSQYITSQVINIDGGMV